jgi:hypothetical protein
MVEIPQPATAGLDDLYRRLARLLAEDMRDDDSVWIRLIDNAPSHS